MTASGFVTIEDAATELGVHRTTLFRYVAEGRLQRHRLMGERRTYLARADVLRLVDSPAVTRCLELTYRRFAETGDWPKASVVQRELVKADDAFDFIAALEALPPELGWRTRDMEGRAQLSLRGIARCEQSAADVNAFIALVAACYEHYVGDDEDLMVSSVELRDALGLDELALAKLYKVVQIEGLFWNGLNGYPDGSWSVNINPDRIRHFAHIETFADYLAAKERAIQPSAAPVPVTFAADEVSVPDPTPDWHPAIAAAVGELLAADNPTPAVLAAATAFERLLSTRIPAERLTGRALVSRFFDMAQRTTPPDPRRVEALKSIALGALGAFRNPTAHGRRDFDSIYAREVITLFSLLYREAEVLLPPTAADHAPGESS
jgi:excisionase family DNA binding protein